MKFGLNFFPSFRPSDYSTAEYFAQCLRLAARADQLGFNSVKTVEHYFFDYGGHSPNPIVFLAAVAARTTRIRLITGAVIPAFNHPVKLAAELAMLDNLSGGRLDVGFGRAFIPKEFEVFGVDMADSRARFEEGIDLVTRLWTEDRVSHEGRFHRLRDVHLQPRPVQTPHPPVWIASIASEESFVWAGRRGYHVMIVPYAGSMERVRDLVRAYRAAWRDAGHPPGREQVQSSLHCYVAETGREAVERRSPARRALHRGLQRGGQLVGRVISASQYASYGKMVDVHRPDDHRVDAARSPGADRNAGRRGRAAPVPRRALRRVRALAADQLRRDRRGGGAANARAARPPRHAERSTYGWEPARVNARTCRSVRRHVLIYAGLSPFLVIALFPIYWMVITAFKRDSDLYAMNVAPFWFHQGPTLDHFILLIKQDVLRPVVVNSLLLAACVVTITVLTAVPAGYALARLRLPGAENLGIGIFMTYLVPPIILFIPLACAVGGLGLFDSWWALVLVYPTFTIPFCTWKMFGYFKAVPREIEEAAWVDGCSLSAAMIRIVVPLSRQGVLITAIFSFSLAMQEFLYAVVYVAPRSEQVVTVGLMTVAHPGRYLLLGLADGRRPDHRHPGRDPLSPRPRSVHPGAHRELAAFSAKAPVECDGGVAGMRV